MSTLQYRERKKKAVVKKKNLSKFFCFKEKPYLCGPKQTITPYLFTKQVK